MMRHSFPKLNKWDWILSLQKDYRQRNPFALRFAIGICKYIKYPQEGATLKSGVYKGFLLFIDFSFIVTVQTLTQYWLGKKIQFVVPRKIEPRFLWY